MTGFFLLIVFIAFFHLALGFLYARWTPQPKSVPTRRGVTEPAVPLNAPGGNDPEPDQELHGEANLFPEHWRASIDPFGLDPASSVEASALYVRYQCAETLSKLIPLDDRARDFDLSLETKAAVELTRDIESLHGQWVDGLEDVTNVLDNASETSGEGEQELCCILVEHREHLTATMEKIRTLDFENDLFNSVQELITRLCELTAHIHRLRDEIESILAIAIAADRLQEDGCEAVKLDTKTGCDNRLGIESRVSYWWQEEPRPTQAACMALIDVDYFVGVNQQWGIKAGDQVIVELAHELCRFAEAESSIHSVARFAGQMFALFFGETSAEDAAEMVERIREQIFAMGFDFNENEIKVTARCVVGQFRGDDSVSDVFENLQRALDEGNRIGGNRTVVWNEEEGATTFEVKASA